MITAKLVLIIHYTNNLMQFVPESNKILRGVKPPEKDTPNLRFKVRTGEQN